MSGALQAVFQNQRSFGAPNIINYMSVTSRDVRTRSVAYLPSGNTVSVGTIGGLWGLLSPMTPTGVRSVYNNPTNNYIACCSDNFTGDVWSVSADNSSNYYGYGNTTISSNNGNPTMFIAKYNSSGTAVFSRKFTNLMSSSFGFMRIGKDGNMYIARQDTLFNAPRYMNVMKLSVTGTPSITWQITRRNNNVESWGTDVDADASGNIYVSGSSNPGTIEGCVIKFSSTTTTGNSGVVSWQRKLSLSGVGVYLQAIRLDSADNVYVVATDSNSNTLYLVKYNSSGALQWQRRVTGLTTNQNGQMAVDSSNNIYIIWNVSNTSNVVLKYDSSGAIQWQRSFYTTTTNKYLYMFGVATFATNMALTGYSSGTTGVSSTVTVTLPTDGTKTGTLGTVANSVVVSYAASSYTDSAGNLTDAAGDLANDGNTSYTLDPDTMQNAPQTVTSTSQTIV